MQEEISFGTWLRKQRRALDLSRQAFTEQVGYTEVTLLCWVIPRNVNRKAYGLSSITYFSWVPQEPGRPYWPGILPEMSIEESLDVTRIYLVADQLPAGTPI